jgi:GH25 family lysozyme M1 (1,4-beta-N-acetylmuramidase)
MINGIDVSDNNGIVNWTRNIQFGIAKATQGVTDHDSQFARNWSQMASHNLLRGAYHYMTAGVSSTAQAAYFVAFVKKNGLGVNDMLMLDMESPDITNAQIRSFVSKCQLATGKNLFLYTEYSLIGRFSGLYNNPLVIANPGGVKGNPPSVHPFPVWTIQQYSWNPVDADVFNGTEETWKELVNIKTPAVREKIVANGSQSIAQLAVKAGVSPVALLTETVLTAHTFGSAITPVLNNILEGKSPVTTPIPAGTGLYYLKG